MAVADILSSIGTGLATGAKAVGKAALPIAQRTAEVVSGEAPQIDATDRQHAEKLEDAQINAKAGILESQLQMAQKYGTLTPQQQQDYANQITSLYNKPRHSQQLMDKLRQAVHPNGATAQGPQTPLPDATPPGGTLSADDASKEKAEGRKLAHMLAEIDERGQVAKNNQRPSLSKSPPLPGNQLPADALGPDGQPINQAVRDAGHSFTQYQGAWWPVAQPKPTIKTIGGRMILVNPQTGQKLRDLGAAGQVKITTRETLQPGDDGQMHLVKLHSVSGPGGEQINVEPETDQVQKEKEKADEAAKPEGAGPAKHSTGAKRVGGLLPKTGAQPMTGTMGPQAGPVVPGMSKAADRKLETTADRNTLEASQQTNQRATDLLSLLESRKEHGGAWDALKERGKFAAYQHGLKSGDPDQDRIYEDAAFIGISAASLWSKVGRSKYTFEVIQQHLPKPGIDTPALMYDKVKWLQDHVIPEAQAAVNNPQASGAPSSPTTHSVGERKTFPNGKTGVWDGTGWVAQ